MKETNVSGSFDWDSYLLDTNAVLADKKCFKQTEIPPDNFFEVDVLLEAVDQRSAVHDITPLNFQDTSNKAGKHKNSGFNQLRRYRAAPFSLAYVVEIWGPRIRVRLVGTDDRNDNWFMIDSDQIRPYPSGEPLQPPFGYMKSHNAWNKTIKKESESKRAALKEWFFKPPPDPKGNLFKINDKLEAIDKRNAQLICPASIGAISGQHILVRFDGWSGAFDYWTRYDSRDIFPVGWCKNANHPLQAPGPTARLIADPPVNNKSHEENMEDERLEKEDIETTLRNTKQRNISDDSSRSSMAKKKRRKMVDSSIKSDHKIGGENLSDIEAEIDAMLYTKGRRSRKKKPINLSSFNQPTVNDYDHSFDDNLEPNSHSSPVKKETKKLTKFNLEDLISPTPSSSLVNRNSSSQSSSEPCTSVKTLKSNEIPVKLDEDFIAKSVSDVQKDSPFTINPIDFRYIKDPANWSIDQVNDYLISKSESLREAAALFREHEIDGQAFLLLNYETLNWMELKAGPSLKIIHLIECLSRGYY